MKFKFKPEDFEGMRGHFQKDLQKQWCERANQLLDAYVATLPKVETDKTMLCEWLEAKILKCPTHRARLWGVEEIKPKKCEHDLISADANRNSFRKDIEFRCDVCGKRLVAKWEEA